MNDEWFMQGNIVLQRDDNSPNFEARHTFIVRAGNDGRWLQSHDGTSNPSISFESLSSPGSFITRPALGTVRAHSDSNCTDTAPDLECKSLAVQDSPFPDACRSKAGEHSNLILLRNFDPF